MFVLFYVSCFLFFFYFVALFIQGKKDRKVGSTLLRHTESLLFLLNK